MDAESDTSSSDILDQRNEEGWEDLEDDTEAITVVSLFDDRTFGSAKEMLSHCKQHHGFDIWKVRSELGTWPSLSNWAIADVAQASNSWTSSSLLTISAQRSRPATALPMP